uniref:Uncharacterized protein n=1 Tax=Timema bartmani TaxID=61472 RepID=A0A7R9F5G7_9NEOP|nr:unnamed protein product [Timema bartmani]
MAHLPHSSRRCPGQPTSTKPCTSTKWLTGSEPRTKRFPVLGRYTHCTGAVFRGRSDSHSNKPPLFIDTTDYQMYYACSRQLGAHNRLIACGVFVSMRARSFGAAKHVCTGAFSPVHARSFGAAQHVHTSALVNMSSGFISEAELTEQRRVRQEEWDKVRKPEEPEG